MNSKYTYVDHNHNQWINNHYEGLVIFECIAKDILQADKALETALTNGSVKLIPKNEKDKSPKSLDLNKLPYIGCMISKVSWLEKVVDFVKGIW